MTAREANDKGHRIGNHSFEEDGYEVTYPNGYKSWSPKEVVNAHTLTGFDTVRHSSCVDPKNYSEELGKQYAMEEVINSLWGHLGFVLQWAKDGLKK